MKSINRLEIKINTIYKIVRRFYIEHFPYPHEFNALEALNLAMNHEEFKRVTPGELVTKGQEIIHVGEKNHATRMFEDPQLNNLLIRDVEALQKWLEKNGFIKDLVATEKMFATDMHFQ